VSKKDTFLSSPQPGLTGRSLCFWGGFVNGLYVDLSLGEQGVWILEGPMKSKRRNSSLVNRREHPSIFETKKVKRIDLGKYSFRLTLLTGCPGRGGAVAEKRGGKKKSRQQVKGPSSRKIERKITSLSGSVNFCVGSGRRGGRRGSCGKRKFEEKNLQGASVLVYKVIKSIEKPQSPID